jgi:hypothetical protein
MVAYNKDFEAKRLAISKSAKLSASKPAFKKPFGPISGSDSKKRLDVAPEPVKVRSAKGQKKASYKARKLAKTLEQTSQIMETSVAGESSMLAQLSHFQAHAFQYVLCFFTGTKKNACGRRKETPRVWKTKGLKGFWRDTRKMPDVICAIVQNGKSPIEGGTRSANSMSGRNLRKMIVRIMTSMVQIFPWKQ